MSSFKVKLVAYFVLLALVPLAATFWGFRSIAMRSELRQADARLQAGLRATVAAYDAELADARARADSLARRRDFARALARRNRPALERLLPARVRVVAPGLSVGSRPRGRVVTESVTLTSPRGPLGRVVAAVVLDDNLARRLAERSGLTGGDRLRFVAGRAPLQPATVTLGSVRYRAVAAPPLEVLTPKAKVGAAAARTEHRLLAALLATLVLVGLVAWLEGSTIVRSIRRLVGAANAIAKGDLDRRVPVQGRDELAVLAGSFNDMAQQLGERLQELEAERGRLQDAITLFGAALTATHDVDQLLRVVLDAELEATGATGGLVIVDGGIAAQAGVIAGDERIEVPLRAGRTNFGRLVLSGESFSDDDRMTAASLAAHAVVALDIAHLHRIVEQQALVDGLTGLANRRAGERALAGAAVRQPGEPVDERLLLDDPVQVRDVERHDRVRRERRGRHPVVVAEALSAEDEPAEVRAAGAQRHLDSLVSGDHPGLRCDPTVDDHEPAGRAGRLELGVQHDPEQLVDVVRRGERRAEERDRVLQAPALGLELLQPLAELLRHVVERAREYGELVASLHRHAAVEISLRDRVRCAHQPADRADDRAPLEPRDEADEDERREQCGEQAMLGPRRRRVDLRLRCQHLERRRRDGAVAHAPERHRRRLERRAAGDEPETVAARQTGTLGEPAGEVVVEDDRCDDATERAARTRERDALRDDAAAGARADAQAGRDDAHAGGQQALEGGAVPACERAREVSPPGQAVRARACVRELGVVRGDRGAETCLQPCIGLPQLAAHRDRPEAPERGRERHQREQHEIGHKLDLEAAHPLSIRPPLPISPLHSSVERGEIMRVLGGRATAGLLLSGAVFASLALPRIFESSQGPLPAVAAPATTLPGNVFAPADVFASRTVPVSGALAAALRRAAAAPAGRALRVSAIPFLGLPHGTAATPEALTPGTNTPTPAAPEPVPAPAAPATPAAPAAPAPAPAPQPDPSPAPAAPADNGNGNNGQGQGNGNGQGQGNGNAKPDHGGPDNGHGNGKHAGG